MRVGIDAFGLSRSLYTGKENYIYNLFDRVLGLDLQNKYTFFSPKEEELFSKFSNTETKKTLASNSYTFWNQFFLPLSMSNSDIDLMCFTESMVPGLGIKNKYKKIVFIYDVMYLYVPDEFSKKARLILQHLIPYSVKNADKIITISQSSKIDLIKHYKAKPENIHIISPAIDTSYFKPVSNIVINNIKEKYEIRGRYIVFIGSNHKYKNLKNLVKAFSVMQAKEDVMLVIIGKKDKLNKETYSFIRENKLDGRIIFTGYIESSDLKDLLASASLFVLPSLYEGFGIPLLEAMACGVPIITSNVSSMPEVVGNAGLLVDPLNHFEIAEKMQAVINNDDMAKQMIQKGFNQVQAFNLNRSADAFISIVNGF
jgi:glycosyltransferase involved in cell wall biosynthesis